MKLKLDLHEYYSDDRKLRGALVLAMEEAKAHKAKNLEIIPGKGSGSLKKFVLKFLQEHYKGVYNRIEKDDKNWGRIIVHFRWGT